MSVRGLQLLDVLRRFLQDVGLVDLGGRHVGRRVVVVPAVGGETGPGAQARDAVPELRDLLVQFHAISLLDRVVRFPSRLLASFLRRRGRRALGIARAAVGRAFRPFELEPGTLQSQVGTRRTQAAPCAGEGRVPSSRGERVRGKARFPRMHAHLGRSAGERKGGGDLCRPRGSRGGYRRLRHPRRGRGRLDDVTPGLLEVRLVLPIHVDRGTRVVSAASTGCRKLGVVWGVEEASGGARSGTPHLARVQGVVERGAGGLGGQVGRGRGGQGGGEVGVGVRERHVVTDRCPLRPLGRIRAIFLGRAVSTPMGVPAASTSLTIRYNSFSRQGITFCAHVKREWK